jgi:hypothetical protein
MSPTPKQLNDVADWLDECMKCGKKHAFIWNVPSNPRSGGTWASPDDGHAYFRRAYSMSTSNGVNGLPDGLRRAALEMSEVKV